MKFGISVAWHNAGQKDSFLAAWGLTGSALPPWLFLQQDEKREGGAKTKNKAVRRAVEAGAEVIVAMDDDCYPTHGDTLEGFASRHIEALKPQPVRLFAAVTDPPSRGTPYSELDAMMPVAASMGFWTEIGDYCAVRQLAFGPLHPMAFKRETIFGRYFPLCAMNYAFRPSEWDPFFYLVEDVGRFDDIWMGWMWQRHAYERNACFNLNGPLVRHSRQSNVWKNLRDEALRAEVSETLWKKIALHPKSDYPSLRALISESV